MLTIPIPGSKSHTNRALIMAALTKGSVSLRNPLYSDDTEAMISCLKTLGLTIETTSDTITVYDDISSIKPGHFELFARESGTTLRFILALLCLIPGTKIVRGAERLSTRPIRDLVDALSLMGAQIEYCEEEGKLPLKVLSSTLPLSSVDLKSDLSSQFCSSLLLIAPALNGTLTIRPQGRLISKSYIDMTLHCMHNWGISANYHPQKGYVVKGGQAYLKKEEFIEGDFSSAGYFLALSALSQSKFFLENLNGHSTQPDRQFLATLEKMGSAISYKETGIEIEGGGVRSLDVDMEDCPDQVMTLAVLSAFANGMTRISGIRSLRDKESNRVVALRTELAKMGILTEETLDVLTIYGGSPRAAKIKTYNDHRIAMSFAIAKARLPNIEIEHPEVVEKTFPNFWELFARCL